MKYNVISNENVLHAVYQAVYTETFNRLVARSMEENSRLWDVGPYKRPRNGGVSRPGNSSRKKELHAIAKVAHETAQSAMLGAAPDYLDQNPLGHIEVA
tara:strand:- start:161 stop:457 length:297 start_codon:yes stop_codon:yes gene_type:complete